MPHMLILPLVIFLMMSGAILLSDICSVFWYVCLQTILVSGSYWDSVLLVSILIFLTRIIIIPFVVCLHLLQWLSICKVKIFNLTTQLFQLSQPDNIIYLKKNLWQMILVVKNRFKLWIFKLILLKKVVIDIQK